MKCLFPIPQASLDHLKRSTETGIGYRVASVELKDGRCFDQVVVSECCIIEVRGFDEISFAPDEVSVFSVNHKRWNFRDGSDARIKSRAARA